MANLVLSDEQILLKDTAHRFFTEKTPVIELRKLRDDQDADGFSRELWAEMAEQGWAGVAVQEVYGGVEFGHVGLGLVLEESGRTLTASPLVSTVLLGANLLSLGGNDMQRQILLPDLVQGNMLMALALEEGYHHNPTHVATSAEKMNVGYRLNGNKTFVLDGHVADKLVVAARTSGEADDADGITLFLVDGGAAGITRTRTTMVDSRNAANITFEDVHVGDNA
ncbi:MAG: acyl-CoA dehydrogenase family protein, partial [Pseudomonadota bacterium]